MTHVTYIEIRVEVEYNATPYDPGVTRGPPESCYPPEGGEVEITEATYNEQKIQLTDADEKLVMDEIQEKIAKEGNDYCED